MSSKTEHKRRKLYRSRIIRTEVQDPSFKDERLNVEEFLKSREFEVNQLQMAQLKSKKNSSTRCFQSLPRSMRRRTASHNIKRVPRRLRPRMIREMTSNNGSILTKKPKHSRGRELYKLKRLHRLLKLATVAKSKGKPLDLPAGLDLKEKLRIVRSHIAELQNAKDAEVQTYDNMHLKFIKLHQQSLNNKLGSMDNTAVNELAVFKPHALKYSNRQKKFKWLPTHVWHAKRAHMIKRWGFNIALQPSQKCYRATHRNYLHSHCIAWDTSYIGTIILHHPTSLTPLIELVGRLSKNKAIKPKFLKNHKIWEGIIYQDNEDSIGHSQIIWQDLANVKQCILRVHPSLYESLFKLILKLAPKDVTVFDCRYSLASFQVAGPAALTALGAVMKTATANENWKQLCSFRDNSMIPTGSSISFYINDPRYLNKPHKYHHNIREDELDLVIAIKEGKVFDSASFEDLFTYQGRIKSYKNQPSLKELDLRRNIIVNNDNVENLGKTLPRNPDDPLVPIHLSKLENGYYQVIVPWYWNLPVWYKLMRFPEVRYGGLRQMHQLNLESNRPTYPFDYPFWYHGFVSSFIQGRELQKKWELRPKGKRLSYSKLNIHSLPGELLGELGDPFVSDWRYLQALQYALKVHKECVHLDPSSFDVSNWTTLGHRCLKQLQDVYECVRDVQRQDSEFENADEEKILPIPIKYQGEYQFDPTKIDNVSVVVRDEIPKLPVTLISVEIEGTGHITTNARLYQVPSHDWQSWLANNEQKPVRAKYLVGFVTTGTLNLASGKHTGIGCMSYEVNQLLHKENHHHLLLRNVGEVTFRLVKFQDIPL
ncbi:BA75_04071T0 [Komagataella pastoris]|uniref:BA75_04071T0 n=1 Tax=Komagataella pastoris TaxID=4922 RepID=A0A1B2JEA9_PICPA|nr:BA75_04071T0 [Komagataella pastoris]